MSDPIRTLSIRAMLDTGDYARGAAEVARANREMAASGSSIVTSLAQTDGSLSRASAGFSRLATTYVAGVREQQKFQTELRALNTALETGKTNAAGASAVYAGLVQKFGMTADGAQIAAQGFRSLGTVIGATNEQLQRLAAQTRATEGLATMTQRAAALRSQIDPLATSQSRLNTELLEYNAMLRAGVISTNEFSRAQALARTRHEQFAASLNRTSVAGGPQHFQTANIAAQFQDVGVTAAMGMNPLMIGLQQGTQLAAVLGPMGATGAVRGLGVALASVFSLTSLTTIGLIAGAAALIQWGTAWARSGAQPVETLKQQLELIKQVSGKWGETLPTITAYVDQLERAEKLKNGQAATEAFADRVFAPSQEKMKGLGVDFTEATRSLDQVPIGLDKFRELNSSFANLSMSVKNSNTTLSDLDRVREALTSAISTSSTPELLKFKETFDQLSFGIRQAAEEAKKAYNEFYKAQSGGSTVQEILDNNYFRDNSGKQQDTRTFTPLNPPVPTFRPPYELEGDDATVKSTEKAEKATDSLMRATQQRIEQAKLEISISGMAKDVQAKLRLEYELQAQYLEKIASIKGAVVDPAEVAAIKAKADALADLNQQVAAQKHDLELADTTSSLQLQADLIGKTSEEQARANAIFQENLKLRQDGLSLYGQEADARRALAADQASALQDIQRQNAAYQSLQQAEGSAIDTLVTGTGTVKERLASMAQDALKWFEQMAIANPLKNALTGTNLPTLDDLFSGKPSVPGAQSTASMTVTAAVVNVNGGGVGFPTSGVPGANSSLFDLIAGKTPNGVRPDVVGGALVNSPVASSNIEAYKQAISQIESGSTAGNYSALGAFTKSGDRAYGRYQVMGDNIPSWTAQHYGQSLTPDQFLANPKAQDAVFTGEFGGYADKYGASGAASKWFTGSATPTGKMDVNGTVDNQYVSQFNANLQKLSTTTTVTSKNIAGLGDNSTDASKSIMDAFGSTSPLAKMPTSAAPPTLPTNYFPPAPTAGATGGGIGGFFSSIFSMFGFADGTDFSPGGMALVGERGPEIVNLPRGSQVIPNHKSAPVGGSGSAPGRVRHEYNIVVSGNGDKELMERMQAVAEETVRGGIETYDRLVPERMRQVSDDPFARG